MHKNFVIIDSNFVLLPFQFKIDYLTEITRNLEGVIEFIVYKQILDELKAKKKREEKKTKFKNQLKAGLLYLNKFKDDFNIKFKNNTKIEYEKTDDFLLRKCIELKKVAKHIFLATNDAELRKRAKSSGINVIFMRQRKLLDIE
jgi:rRNA-processing protein FCF1